MTAQTNFVLMALAFCGLASATAIVLDKDYKPPAAVTAAAGGGSAMGPITLPPGHADKGAQLYTGLGCVACHSADGSARVGPSLFDIYGKPVHLADGSTLKVDDAYVRESLLSPSAKVVKGFIPTMPSFQGRVADQDVADIVAWMKTLK